MKFSLFTGLAIGALSLGALAAPAAVAQPESDVATIEKRASASLPQAIDITSNLLAEIKTYTGAINATSASLTPTSSKADKKAAAASVGKNIQGITTAVKSARKQVKALPKGKRDLENRQAAGPATLAALVAEIVLELSGALSAIIADLGLDPLLSFLTPLLASLSGLLLSLEVVVNNLLALVEALLDGLLTGLAAGLAGLIV